MGSSIKRLIAALFVVAGILLVLSVYKFSPLSGGKVLEEPVYWHVMGEEAHMSLRLREQSRGKQTVRLDMWLPSDLGKPLSAGVILRHGEKTAEVPVLFKEGGADPYGFEGFNKYTYEAEGRFISGSGTWILEVSVTDKDGKLYNYKKEEVIPLQQ